jgi:hypothetical protein
MDVRKYLGSFCVSDPPSILSLGKLFSPSLPIKSMPILTDFIEKFDKIVKGWEFIDDGRDNILNSELNP